MLPFYHNYALYVNSNNLNLCLYIIYTVSGKITIVIYSYL